jgi:hypothetical protein
VTGLTDLNECPQKYIDLYKKLPSITPLNDDLDAYTLACPATQCADDDCNDLLSHASAPYDAAFKASLKDKCFPAGAASLFIDACTKGDDTKVTGLTDLSECPQKYIDLYKKLPSTTPLTSDLAAYAIACPATQCTKPACINIIGGTSINYNAAFKASFKDNCIPIGAANLLLDECRKGDDTKITDLEDKEECIKTYEDLIKLLPDAVSAGKNRFNKSLLEDGATAFTSFVTNCLKSICDKDDCYEAIIKTTPDEYDSVLKKTLTENCNPHPTGGDGNNNVGLLSISNNKIILLVTIIVMNFNFWL